MTMTQISLSLPDSDRLVRQSISIQTQKMVVARPIIPINPKNRNGAESPISIRGQSSYDQNYSNKIRPILRMFNRPQRFIDLMTATNRLTFGNVDILVYVFSARAIPNLFERIFRQVAYRK